MLDTIRVKFPISPESDQLQSWTRKTTTTETGGEREYFLYNPKVTEDEVMLKYTYYPLGYDCKPLLTLELSLPKLMYGNNYRMLLSIDGSIKKANELLANVPHAPILDLAEGILIRLDMCYNHQVGDAVEDYVKAIGNLDYPHRWTKYHRYEGVEFRAKHITSKFYNKQRETGSQEAFGILRQEVTLLEPKDIQRLLGKRRPTLLDVPRDIVVDYLKADLRKLSLLDNSIATRNTALKMLCDAHGETAGVYYFGLLVSKMDKSRKGIASETHTHPRSLDRKLRKIVDTGIPLTLTDREEPLPPLNIHL
jgi:hypothetical protein